MTLSRSATVIALGLLAAPSGVALADPVRFTAMSGRELRLAFASEMGLDCSSSSTPDIQIAADAQHGKVRIVYDRGKPSFTEDNPRYACNSRSIKGLGVYYRSEKGFVGDDSLSLHYVFHDGGEQTIDYAITVIAAPQAKPKPHPKASTASPTPSPTESPTATPTQP